MRALAAAWIQCATRIPAGPPCGRSYWNPPSSATPREDERTMPSANPEVRPRLWARIDGLDSDHGRGDHGGVAVEVLQELELRRRGTHHEDVRRALDRPRHLVEEPLGILGVFLRARLAFRMPAVNVLRRSHRGFVGLVLGDMEDPRFAVIDPDRGARRQGLSHPRSCSTFHAALRAPIPSWPEAWRVRCKTSDRRTV